MPSLRRTSSPSTSRPGAKTGKPATPAKAAKPAKTKVPRGEKVRQLRTAFTLTRQGDPRLVALLLVALLGPIVVLLAIGLLTGHALSLGLLGVLVAVVAAVAVFGRRMQKMQYAQVEGQPGAAAAVLQTMRGNWRVTPAVGFTREQDLVHRVVGLPGVVLVAEGSPHRTRSLIGTEKKRLARFLGDTPVYDVTVGDGDGQVALKDLQRHLLKLPRNIKPAKVNDLDRMFKAMAPALPIPKGPMPSRVPRGRMR